MSVKTQLIHTRIEPNLKATVEAILKTLGLNTSEAIKLFLSQVVLNNGIPFDVKIPNKLTQKTLVNAQKKKGIKKVKNLKSLMDEIE